MLFVYSKKKMGFYCILMQVVLCNKLIISSNLSGKKSFDVHKIDKSKIDPQEIRKLYANSGKQAEIYSPNDPVKLQYALPCALINSPDSLVARMLLDDNINFYIIRNEVDGSIFNNSEQSNKLIQKGFFFIDNYGAINSVICIHKLNFHNNAKKNSSNIIAIKENKEIDFIKAFYLQQNHYGIIIQQGIEALESLVDANITNDLLLSFKNEVESIKGIYDYNYLEDEDYENCAQSYEALKQIFLKKEQHYINLVKKITSNLVKYFYKPILENNN